MGKPRALLRTLAIGTAGRRHECWSDKNHVLHKGDPMLIVKVDRDSAHYCSDCARKFIDTARQKLSLLEQELERTTPPSS
jgi:hypothetical protein